MNMLWVIPPLLCASCAQPLVNSGPLHTGPVAARVAPQDEIGRSTPLFCEKTDHNRGLIFCATSDPNDPIFHRPTIFRHGLQGWELLDFNFEPFAGGMEWVHVAISRDLRHIWAIAEWTVEGPGPSAEIVFSDDGGDTWQHIASVKKPFYVAIFAGFRMDAKGNGSLVYSQLDEGGWPGIGHYTYSTHDWGKTWFGPAFSEDIMCYANYVLAPESKSLAELMESLTVK